MSIQIRSILVTIIAFFILYVIVRTANRIGAPNIFTLGAVLVGFIILWNFLRRLI
jgi:hypothetical protein